MANSGRVAAWSGIVAVWSGKVAVSPSWICPRRVKSAWRHQSVVTIGVDPRPHVWGGSQLAWKLVAGLFGRLRPRHSKLTPSSGVSLQVVLFVPAFT